MAVSDPGRVLASPHAVVPTGELSSHLRRLIDKEGVLEVVVGVPRTLGGQVGFQARKVLDTLDGLRDEFPGVRFVEWDERLTTRIAVAGTRARRGGKKQRGAVRVDDLAAARLLQEYLETKGNF